MLLRSVIANFWWERELMLKSKLFAFALCISVGTGMAVEANASTLLDSIDASAPLLPASWVVEDVGFSYTPAFSYTLDGIASRFLNTDGRTVTAAIYLGLPGSLTLLGSGGLIPVANSFATAPISPVALTVGVTYFVAFENVFQLANLTNSGADSTTYYGDHGGLIFNLGPYTNSGTGLETEFFGTVDTTPLPAALPLFATGLGAFGLLGWRRKRKAQAAA